MSDTVVIGEVELSGLTPGQKTALDLLASGATLKDLRGLTATDIESIYAIGYNLYQQAKHAAAEPMFQFACLYQHTEPRYWMALGNCRQMSKSYRPAIDAYAMAYVFDSDDPWPCIQTALCHLALGDRENAAESLGLADKSLATGRRDDATARGRIAALRQAL